MIFLDEGIGRSVYEALLRVRLEGVKYVREEFRDNGKDGRGVDDVIWLQMIGERRWLAITRDKQILKQVAERRTLIQYQVGLIVLDDDHATSFQLLQMIVCHRDRLLELHEGMSRPFAYVMDRRGRLSQHQLDADGAS